MKLRHTEMTISVMCTDHSLLCGLLVFLSGVDCLHCLGGA